MNSASVTTGPVLNRGLISLAAGRRLVIAELLALAPVSKFWQLNSHTDYLRHRQVEEGLGSGESGRSLYFPQIQSIRQAAGGGNEPGPGTGIWGRKKPLQLPIKTANQGLGLVNTRCGV